MSLYKKSDAVEIYDLFCSCLNKVHALFLLGLYYSSNCFTKNDIEKKIIISQQLLTFLKRNPFPELDNGNTIERLFRDSSFSNSASKINMFEIFKMISPETSVKVI